LRDLEIELDFDCLEPACYESVSGRIRLRIGSAFSFDEIKMRLGGALTDEEWDEFSKLWAEDLFSERSFQRTADGTLIIRRGE
jgi:hypothetical protein